MRAIRLLPEILEDIAQAAKWYDDQGFPGLGDRFLAVFYAGIFHIQQQGEIYSPVYKEFRRTLLKPFPYAIYYRNHDDDVVIVLVIHAARNTRLIRKLLQNRTAS